MSSVTARRPAPITFAAEDHATADVSRGATMNSRERVLKAVNRERPDRVPIAVENIEAMFEAAYEFGRTA